MAPEQEPLIDRLQYVIRMCVRAMAVMMIFVIIMGVVDIGWVIWQRLASPPRFILTIADMLATFGAFMAVLIAIEIFVNITIYLREEVIHIKIVIATALMAVARKVIILDQEKTEPLEIFALAVLVIATGVGYWLVQHTPSVSVRAAREDTAERPPARRDRGPGA